MADETTAAVRIGPLRGGAKVISDGFTNPGGRLAYWCPHDGAVDTATFLASASELLAVPSTADRPDDLHRALSFVLDFVGPGFTVERFESAGKPSALLYARATRPRFRFILNAHLDVVPAPRTSSSRA